MKKLGFVGYRGMVGQVLLKRMQTEGDLKFFTTTLYSSSKQSDPSIQDSNNLDSLFSQDIILTTQGSDYTQKIHPELRAKGWKGYWIDAASLLRMKSESTLLLDPINLKSLESAVDQGKKDFIGSNCTVSLMLMAINGLFQENLIEWVSSMTYQAASGAGAQAMTDLLQQMKIVNEFSLDQNIIELESLLTQKIKSQDFSKTQLMAPLALNLFPWIDSFMENGQTKEEWKGQSEANKILNTSKTIPIDGTCVRVGALRCHSQGLTIKLKKNISIDSIHTLLKNHQPWLKLVENERMQTLKELTPVAVSGSLNIGVGRIRKMSFGDEYLNVFTVGDQLLWGAAEPLRRFLLMIK